MTEVNIPLLRKAVEWAETEAAKPEIDRQWQQGEWLWSPDDLARELLTATPLDELSGHDYTEAVAALAPHCGTAFCIAGYVGQSLDARYTHVGEVDGVHVSDFACEALGLTSDQAYGENGVGGLFVGHNTIEDIRRIAEEIAGERL